MTTTASPSTEPVQVEEYGPLVNKFVSVAELLLEPKRFSELSEELQTAPTTRQQFEALENAYMDILAVAPRLTALARGQINDLHFPSKMEAKHKGRVALQKTKMACVVLGKVLDILVDPASFEAGKPKENGGNGGKSKNLPRDEDRPQLNDEQRLFIRQMSLWQCRLFRLAQAKKIAQTEVDRGWEGEEMVRKLLNRPEEFRIYYGALEVEVADLCPVLPDDLIQRIVGLQNSLPGHADNKRMTERDVRETLLFDEASGYCAKLETVFTAKRAAVAAKRAAAQKKEEGEKNVQDQTKSAGGNQPAVPPVDPKLAADIDFIVGPESNKGTVASAAPAQLAAAATPPAAAQAAANVPAVATPEQMPAIGRAAAKQPEQGGVKMIPEEMKQLFEVWEAQKRSKRFWFSEKFIMGAFLAVVVVVGLFVWGIFGGSSASDQKPASSTTETVSQPKVEDTTPKPAVEAPKEQPLLVEQPKPAQPTEAQKRAAAREKFQKSLKELEDLKIQ